jgi:hypothetical protein
MSAGFVPHQYKAEISRPSSLPSCIKDLDENLKKPFIGFHF